MGIFIPPLHFFFCLCDFSDACAVEIYYSIPRTSHSLCRFWLAAYPEGASIQCDSSDVAATVCTSWGVDCGASCTPASPYFLCIALKHAVNIPKACTAFVVLA